MKTITIKINPGVCGNDAVIKAVSEDGQDVSIAIESPCRNIQAYAEKIGTVDAFQEIAKGFDGEILKSAFDTLKGCCSACAVPIGAFKAMQVAADLALPRPISMEFDDSKEK